MEITELLRIQYNRVGEMLHSALEGLTPEELNWRPGYNANSIAVILFHIARWEDQYLHSRMHGTKDLWETQEWYNKFNMPLGKETYPPIQSEEDVVAFKAPPIEVLIAYEKAARAELVKFLEDKKPEDFDKMIDYNLMGRINRQSLGHFSGTMVMHLGRHCGEMLYLRHMQRHTRSD